MIMFAGRRPHPLRLAKLLWPDDYWYLQQREIVESVWSNDETVVSAGNMLGKDYIAGRIIILYFLTHHTCRIVNTSAKDDHLRVLWGEIATAIQTSRIPLTRDQGGPLICNQREIRRWHQGRIAPKCYIKGMVASTDAIASMQGHHAQYTLFVTDESSSVPDDYFRMANGWAKKKLIVGNPWACSNYFFRSVEGDTATNDKGGDIEDPLNPGRYYRKIIKIKAEHSPNVRLGLAQVAAGKKPTDEVLVPGLKTYSEYVKNRMLWDPIQQCVSLDAEFYKGKEVYLFPEASLQRARKLAEQLRNRPRRAKSMGVDAAEGGDDTVWTIIDEFGIIDQVSIKTADTADIPGRTIALIKQHGLRADQVFFDRGGGGKQHADQLRRRGYDVRTIGFGEAATDPHKTRKTSTVKAPVKQRVDVQESAYVYKNRRAEMYGLLSNLLESEPGFAIPGRFAETLRQLAPIPKMYDGEGRLYLPPKDKPHANYKGSTIKQLVGRSPDQADSLVLAVYGMVQKPVKAMAGPAM